MLARQQRRRHYHRDLFAADGREKAARNATSVLPKPTSPQISRSIGRPEPEILDGRVDGRELVVGLLVRKAGAEFVIGARPNGQSRRLAQLPLGRNLDQFARNFADAALHARLARLPVAAAKPIEIDAGLFRAVARKQIDVLDRQIELGVVGVVDFEAVVRRAGGLDWLQAGETANAVVDMDDQIAGRETGRLGDEILRTARGAARPHQAVAEDVLLADESRRPRSRNRTQCRAPRARL